jgi:polar amino acid transport system substrate-binding protein
MRCSSLLVLCVALLLAPLCQARDRWNVCLAELEHLATADGRGAFIELFEVLRMRAPDIDWVLQIHPFARSVHDVQYGRCDLHLPFILVQDLPSGVRYGSGRLGPSYFALYSRRAAALTLEQLRDPRHVVSAGRIESSGVPAPIGERLAPLLGRAVSVDELRALIPEPAYRQQLQMLVYPYRLEGDRAHQHVLGLPLSASNGARASLERLNKGRIDGYIDAVSSVEPIIDALGLRDGLRAELFARYEAGWLRVDSERGRQADAAFLKVLQPLQSSGEYQQIIERHVSFSQHWAPWP